MGFPAAMVNGLRLMRFAGPLLYTRTARDFMKWLIGKFLAPGPSRLQNESGFSILMAEVTDGRHTVRAKLQTPEAYYLTALTSVEIMKNILADNLKTGFQTPSKVFGADFILQFPGVVRQDLQDFSTANYHEERTS
jgi:short subunit dehydrogenase-like uncharacterized protein